MLRKKNRTWRVLPVVALISASAILMSSSHREAPMIANDPLADNTDVYAFRSPDHPTKICIIANYNGGQLPWGGPNYYGFGENIRYEIHIDNNLATPGDDITYRFTFKQVNEDPTTFFNIRLGKRNLRQYYDVEKSTDGGKTFQRILKNGFIAPYNIGPRSITSPVGLGAASYDDLFKKAINTTTSGERVFAGPVEDPFFVDLGGIFDLGDAPRQNGQPSDGLGCLNVSSIALLVDIKDLQKDHKEVKQAANILDPNYVIGVWASASRPKMRVLNGDGTETHSGDWVQVSRLGMPLTNEAVVPIGYKDYWNSLTPYQDLGVLSTFGNFFYNPELSLYMDDAQFGTAIPAFSPLRVQKNSLGSFGFGNGQNGLYSLKGTAAVAGTALDDAAFGTLLLPAPASPRSVDIWPIFHTGVPNLSPYQLAVNKNDNPLAPGKPFINNFLPNGGDMLRLNMAVPVTKRDDPDFSSEGIVQAAVLGLTDPRFNKDTSLQRIPNMDGFPNGRRLEDDVTLIELQAVSGVALAAIGLWYDDYIPGGSPVTPQFLNVLGYRTGVNHNDTTYRVQFPYVQEPWSGTNPDCGCLGHQDNSTPKKPTDAQTSGTASDASISGKISGPEFILTAYPNPFASSSTVKYRVTQSSNITINIFNESGKRVSTLLNRKEAPGTYSVQWNSGNLPKGIYFINASINGQAVQTVKVTKQ